MKYIISVLLVFCMCGTGFSQELNMKITVDATRVQMPDNALFSELQENLNQFVNGNKWTNDSYAVNELIDCVMTLVITGKTDENAYNAEIQITANRPVFNSTYTTPIFRFVDDEIEFSYSMGESFRYSENNVDNNLIAVISYYAYLVLGLDADSFELNSGKMHFEKALYIADAAQSLSKRGWESFGEDRNRYALAKSLTEMRVASFHSLWYDYHRKGLDNMAASTTRGRDAITKSLTDLQKLYQAESLSFVVTLFGDIKLDEIVSLYSGAPVEEKLNVMKTLLSIYPTKRRVIEEMKK